MEEERSGIDRTIRGFSIVLIEKVLAGHEGREVSRLIEQFCTFLANYVLVMHRENKHS